MTPSAEATTLSSDDECRDVDAAPREFETLARLPIASHQVSYLIVAGLTLVVPVLGVVWAVYDAWRFGIRGVDVALLVGMYLITVLGIELGFHRYLTHRSFKTGRGMRALLTLTGCMAGHGQPIWWCAIHRRHHQYSDHQGDPHSPNLHGPSAWERIIGGWHSHIGWMFQPQCTAAYSTHFTKDLLGDRTILFIDRWYPLWVTLGLVIPAAIGGMVDGTWRGAWTGFLWGGLVRMFLDQHALWWGIVTVCHRFGTRPFESHDDSTNNWFVALIFLGDGWHNNHHAFPSSAKVGLRWWELDITWIVIRALQAIGLIWDVKVPSEQAIAKKRRIAA